MKKQLEAELKPIMLTEQEIERIVRETQTVTKPSRKPMLISVVWVATALLFFVLLLPTFTPALHTGATVAFNWWYAIVALFFLSHIVYIYLLRRVKQTIYCPSCGEELSERYLRKKMWKGKTPCPRCGTTTFRLRMRKKMFGFQFYLLAMLQFEAFVFHTIGWPIFFSFLIVFVLYGFFFYHVSSNGCETVESLW